MLTGWVAFLLAWVSTVLFYKTHPSGVESGTSQKLFLYVFGKKKYLCGYKGEKVETIHSTIGPFQNPPTQQRRRKKPAC